jgi:hypothetical protein
MGRGTSSVVANCCDALTIVPSIKPGVIWRKGYPECFQSIRGKPVTSTTSQKRFW